MEDEYYRVGRLILGRKPQHVLVPTGSGRLDALLGGGLRLGRLTVLLEGPEHPFLSLLGRCIMEGRFCYFSKSEGLRFYPEYGRVVARSATARTAAVVAGRAEGTVGLVDQCVADLGELHDLAEIAQQLRIPVVGWLPRSAQASWYRRHLGLPAGTLVCG